MTTRLVFLRKRVTCWRSARSANTCDDELWDLPALAPVFLTGETSEDGVYHRILCHRGLAWIFHAWLD